MRARLRSARHSRHSVTVQQSESYECKTSESKSSESQWSVSKSTESMETAQTKLGSDSVVSSKLDADNPVQAITVKLTGQEMERFRQSFTNSELRKFMRASNADKLEQRKLKDQVKSLSEGIRRLKQTKEMERVEELANKKLNPKENQLRVAQMINKNLVEKLENLETNLSKTEKTLSAEQREHKKRAEEMNKQLEAMRKKVSNLRTTANRTERENSVAEIRRQKEFEKKLEEKERTWMQRLIDAKDEFKRSSSKNKEKAKLRLTQALRERDEAKMTVKKLGNEKSELEYQVESAIFH